MLKKGNFTLLKNSGVRGAKAPLPPAPPPPHGSDGFVQEKKHSVSTKEVNKIALSAIDDKKNSIDSIETYSYGTKKDLVCKEEEI